MPNRVVYRAVYHAVNRTVYWAVNRWDVGGAGNVALNEAEVVPRAVDRAVYRAVSWAVYRAADEGGAVAPHKEPPHPGLGLYLGGVGG